MFHSIDHFTEFDAVFYLTEVKEFTYKSKKRTIRIHKFGFILNINAKVLSLAATTHLHIFMIYSMSSKE